MTGVASNAGRRANLRFGLLGFLATLLVFSLALNAYLLWTMNRPRIVEYLSRFRFPATVTDRDHVRGPSAARTTVIVYGDFQCGYCRELHASLVQLAATEPFRVVYRHFPLGIHPLAQRYAEAAECAGSQGRFWEFADRMYAAPAGQAPVDPRAVAAELGLDLARFSACLETGGQRATVLAQKSEGESLWIDGTPTVFVNGQRFNGLPPADELRRVLRANAGVRMP